MTPGRHIAVALALIAVCLAGVSCSAEPESAAAPGGVLDSGSSDAAGGQDGADATTSDVTASDVAAAETVDPIPDTSLPDTADLAEATDTEPPPNCDAVPRPPGCACTDGDDCDTAICLLSSQGKVCAAFCEPECPTGWDCAEVGLPGAGADSAFVCVERHAFLCMPCQANVDCAAAGFEGVDLCVSYGDEGSYCGTQCAQDLECPQGFECSTDGQCINKVGACTCAPLHIALDAQTSCHATNAAGSCGGMRRCEADGLGACDAPTPTAELCDSADNDCDGQTDEDVTAACELANAFGTCSGTVFCQAGVGICQGAPAESEKCNGLDDNCDGTTDEGFPDLDQDGLANCVDPDSDDDLWVDEDDNCPLAANADQQDTDFDGQGDACDPDDDNDGSGDSQDCEPLQANVYPFAPETCDGVDNDCDGATDESSCNDQNPCTEDTCDAQAGCAFTPNSAVCNDGNPCTQPDECVAGQCQGTFLNCDDNNPCTDDQCDALVGCKNVPNTLACTDSNACTLGDVCSGGVCLGGAPSACDDGQPCTLDVCDAILGCGSTPVAGACSDGNACTSADTCAGGACVGAFIGCDDGNACTADSCDPATGCVFAPTPGVSCDDGNACTEATSCDDAGACVGDDIGCECESDADCAELDDTNACNGTLVCDKSSGAPFECVADPASVIVCPVPTGQHPSCVTPTCDPATGQCAAPAGPDNVVCDDGNPCTAGDQCAAGGCLGTATPCDDANECTFDLCDPAGDGCVFPPVAGLVACDDGDPCTSNDTCGAAVCAGNLPTMCDDGEPCNGQEVCVTMQGCGPGIPLDCSDGEPCNGAEACESGVGCIPGQPLACDDGHLCTVDACAPGQGCVAQPDDSACDDGLFCTGIETCAITVGCQPGTPPALDDGVACTQDLCNEDDGVVDHIPDNSACPPGGDACMAAICDAVAGCDTAPVSDGGPCDHELPCTTDATCLSGQCGNAVSCENAGQICSAGTCTGGGSASVRFGSISMLATTADLASRLRLSGSPPVGGQLTGTMSQALLSALAELLSEGE